MRDSVGGSMLLYIVIIIVTVVMLLFSSILTYSKAYKIKNRIVEIVEKYDKYDRVVAQEINADLSAAGYNPTLSSTRCANIKSKLTTGNQSKYKEYDDQNNQLFSDNKNSYGYNYCVFESTNVEESGRYYVIVTFVEFQIPVINDFLSIPVYSETKILGKNYDY